MDINHHSAQKLTSEQRMAIVALRRAVILLMDIEHKMPLSFVRAFTEVALNPLKGPTAYARSMGVRQPVASRLLKEIGSKARHRTINMNLVASASSPTDEREKEFYLTDEGRALVEAITSILMSCKSVGAGM